MHLKLHCLGLLSHGSKHNLVSFCMSCPDITHPLLTYPSIVNLIIDRLSSIISISEAASTNAEGVERMVHADHYSPELCLYYIELLLKLLQYSPNNTWPALESYAALNGILMLLCQMPSHCDSDIGYQVMNRFRTTRYYWGGIL
jgi:hypothetical protein